MEVNVITLEDNLNYIITDTLENNNGKYLLLANEKDNEDIKFRKVIEKEGKEFLVKLDNDEEFDEVMFTFLNKYGKIGEKNEE